MKTPQSESFLTFKSIDILYPRGLRRFISNNITKSRYFRGSAIKLSKLASDTIFNALLLVKRTSSNKADRDLKQYITVTTLEDGETITRIDSAVTLLEKKDQQPGYILNYSTVNVLYFNELGNIVLHINNHVATRGVENSINNNKEIPLIKTSNTITILKSKYFINLSAPILQLISNNISTTLPIVQITSPNKADKNQYHYLNVTYLE